ncbi:hypothetical protein [Edaphobacter dinghuensis]|uniref:PD(D/E)XK endonuclease domain-containing protein n=1 Tax=Edaphobacter dinghuensis TaxID=1560005 RepID=A0A917H2N6_9BACT|nr:hypothetical protein [Edaphobacter dinghuensis]GGG66050.1 hypothetical protein GCM10011585_04830 [Edaphobacter dinghuensis]
MDFIENPEKVIGAKARSHQTQWAAQFAVASELCKRGYEVAFTSGHTTPVADLMVVSPIKKEMFLVDVKGLYRKNPWLIKRKLPRANLFYILAYVPTGEPNQFFVMTQPDATKLIESELNRLKRADNYPVTGFLWALAFPHQNAWDVLPQ